MLEVAKPKQDFGQPINVADAVKALQEPSEVYGKLAGEPMDATASQREDVPCAATTSTEEPVVEDAEKGDQSFSLMFSNDSLIFMQYLCHVLVTGIESVKTPSVHAGIVALNVDGPRQEQFGSPDPTKAVLGVEQGGVKKRRKPYRPGM